MVSVASLLNPVLEEGSQLPSPTLTRYMSESCSPASPPLKKQKISKDAAIFSRGKVQGPIRYSPWEAYDEEQIKELQRFSVYPIGKISEFRRHIPYNSDKKSFLEKTGRGSFEVFQYTFKMPNEERKHTVMWDYNIGLVRITPFFKCCQYAKTVPAKMLNQNPGLREICHSITGGALAAQGYWMPFAAAKAVVATFGYSIRYVLLPLFGPEILSMCIKPRTEGFATMVIDHEIVRRCTEEAHQYRSIASRESSFAPGQLTPDTASPTASSWAQRPLKGRAYRALELDIDSVDAGRSETYPLSPRSPLEGLRLEKLRSDKQAIRISSPSGPPGDSRSIVARGALPYSPELSVAEPSLKDMYRKYGEGLLGLGEQSPPTPTSSCSFKEAETPELRAAYLLMRLHVADAAIRDNEGPKKKRRASS